MTSSPLAAAVAGAGRELELAWAREEQQQHETGTLRAYVANAWETVEPGTPYVHGWHIDAICEHLEAVTRGELLNLLITVPPRHMKSLAVSVFWPTWVWTFNPERRWLFSSYAHRLALRDSIKSRRLIESAWYQERFGNRYRIVHDQNEKGRFENDHSGYRMATSVGGSATGEGGDIIVVDDPHKIEEASSSLMRESVIDWWDQTMSTRGNDPRTACRVIVQQRVHQGDLAGHVLERGTYEHLCLPAEYEPAHPFVWPDDPRDQEGELLWPERFGRPELEALKRALGSYGAAGQLQQRPAPLEGGLVKRGWWRFFDPETPPPVQLVIQSWDTAFKDKTTSDYVVGQVWGVNGANRYLLREVRGQWSLPETIRQVGDLDRWIGEQSRLAYHPRVVLVENTANGPDVIAAIKHAVTGVLAITPKGDKTQRLLAVTPAIESGNVFLPGFASADGRGADPARTAAWVTDFLEEISSFPNASHDDRVDAMSQALIRAARSHQVGGATMSDYDETSVRRERPGVTTGMRHGMSL